MIPRRARKRLRKTVMRTKRLVGVLGVWKDVKAVPESLEGDVQNWK